MVYYGIDKKINLTMISYINTSPKLLNFLKNIWGPLPQSSFKQAHNNKQFWNLLLLAIVVLKFSLFEDTQITLSKDLSR